MSNILPEIAVQSVGGFGQLLFPDMGINCPSGCYGGVPHNLLRGFVLYPRLEQNGGIEVTELVGG